jgi:hypothetical protein
MPQECPESHYLASNASNTSIPVSANLSHRRLGNELSEFGRKLKLEPRHYAIVVGKRKALSAPHPASPRLRGTVEPAEAGRSAFDV